MTDKTRTFRQMNKIYNAESRAKRDAEIARLNNAGVVARQTGNLETAFSLLTEGLKIDPRHSVLTDNLATVLFDLGDAREAWVRHRLAMLHDPTNMRAAQNSLFAQQYVLHDPSANRELAESFDDNFCWGFNWPQHANDPDPDRKLRVGYVYLGNPHCQDRFLGVLNAHTKAIAVVRYPLSLCVLLTDQELADKIRADQIDVLVDCTMHMAGSRPLVFARKPAPIQIAWLAYPGTTGMRAMDYRISDPLLDPPGTDEDYTEKTLRVPNFWCGYDPSSSVEPSVSPMSLHPYPTFGCLNNPAKVTDDTLRLWAPIFRKLPRARLVLPSRGYRAQELMLAKLRNAGVAPALIEWVPFVTRDEYLRAYNLIDIALDTIPYNGHTTTLDALWVGVPVVSRIGSTCVGRGGASILGNLHRAWAADTDARFVEVAVNMADSPNYLKETRKALRHEMEHSLLMDFIAGAKSLEGAYRTAWHAWCRDSSGIAAPDTHRIHAGEG